MLGEKPVLVQTLNVFERHPEVHHIIVATPAEAVRPLRQELRRVGITKLKSVVSGGTTRQDSVAAALAACPESVGIVLVHDAVRPFVRLSQVSEVIKAARTHGAGALAIPMVDTLRRGAVGFFEETVDREDLMRMQTPQGFRRDWFSEAHQKAASKLRQVMATFRDAEDLVNIGAYVKGSNPEIDEALVLMPKIRQFLRQGLFEPSELEGIEDGILQALS